ncbi:MAG: hypothetical protein AABX66_02775 [Nanoarchaeota archaeon]
MNTEKIRTLNTPTILSLIGFTALTLYITNSPLRRDETSPAQPRYLSFCQRDAGNPIPEREPIPYREEFAVLSIRDELEEFVYRVQQTNYTPPSDKVVPKESDFFPLLEANIMSIRRVSLRTDSKRIRLRAIRPIY